MPEAKTGWFHSGDKKNLVENFFKTVNTSPLVCSREINATLPNLISERLLFIISGETKKVNFLGFKVSIK